MASRDAEKRKRFAEAYLRTMDVGTAAAAAGYTADPELLEKCQEELERQRAMLGGQVTYEDVLRRLVRLGFGSGKECGALLSGDWQEELDLSLVSEVKRGSNGTVEVRLIDRVGVLLRLLELLGSKEDGAEEFLKSLQMGESDCGGS